MKGFLCKLGIWLGFIGLLFGGIYTRYAKQYPLRNGYYMANLDKHSLLTTQSSPRLIFVGGSATAFGVDSERVASRFGLHPVNMGLHLRIGLEFMLAQVQPWVRRGDVIVLSPEYGAFESYYRSEPEFVARMVECQPTLLRTMTREQLKEFLDEGWVRHVGRVSRAVFSGAAPLPEEVTTVYRRASFNLNGDMVAHHALSNRVKGGRSPYRAWTSAAEAIHHLNRFAAACRDQGAQVFLSHPPLEQRLFARNQPAIEELEKTLRDRLQFPLLDMPGEMAFPIEYFFDTVDHLNLKGKLRRSDLIADRLLLALRMQP